MRSGSEQSTELDQADSRELAVLSEVFQAPDLTQRELAGRVGLSLGATNLLLKSLAGKGYVRIKRAGWRRWLYAVTPAGIKRKVALTSAYVSRFMDQYSMVRAMLGDQLGALATSEGAIAVYGRDDFARLVQLVLSEMGREADIYVSTKDLHTVPGLAALDVAGLTPDSYSKIVVADLHDTSARVNELLEMNVPEAQLTVLFQSQPTRRARG